MLLRLLSVLSSDEERGEIQREREREIEELFQANSSSLFPYLFSPPLSDLYFQFS